MDSFSYSGQLQATTACSMHPFLQQLLAVHTQMMAATMGYNMSSMYPNMFNSLDTASDIMNPVTNTLTLPQLPIRCNPTSLTPSGGANPLNCQTV